MKKSSPAVGKTTLLFEIKTKFDFVALDPTHYRNRNPKQLKESNYQIDENQGCHISLDRLLSVEMNLIIKNTLGAVTKKNQRAT